MRATPFATRRLGRRSMTAVAMATLIATGVPVAALASQGPGTGPGTASPTLQVAMAVIVYGVSALIIVAGVIGTLRRTR